MSLLHRLSTRHLRSSASNVGSPWRILSRELAAGADDGSNDPSPGMLNSWMSKLKGVFTGKTSSADPADPEDPANFTLLAFADGIKKTRRLGNVSRMFKVPPAGGEGKILQTLEKNENILRALAKHDPNGEHLTFKQKEEVASECGCTLVDVNYAIARYEMTKRGIAKVKEAQEKGLHPPKSWEEMQEFLGIMPSPGSPSKSPDIGRNSPCRCGSGKRYKRCCGRESRETRT